MRNRSINSFSGVKGNIDAEGPNLKKLLSVLSARRWMVVFLFVFIGSAIITRGAYLPKIYQASTTILFEPVGISKNFVKPMLESPMEKRLRNLSKELKSRSRMKQIISEFQLDRHITDPIEQEDLITGLQWAINVEMKGDEYLEIFFQGQDPVLVMRITNRIADLFIYEHQKNSRNRAQTATTFLSRESEKVHKELKIEEARLQAFRQEHHSELPEQKELNLRMLDRLQSQLQNNEPALINAQEQEMFLKKQLSGVSLTLTGEGGGYSSQANYMRLEALRQALAELKPKYSDQWPEVKKIKREIADLTRQMKVTPTASKKKRPIIVKNPTYRELKNRLNRVKKTITSIKANRELLISETEEYKRRVENLPQIEQKLLRLMDNYNALKNNYDALEGKKLEAKLSENFQFARDDGYFRILDPAELPLIPIKPNMGQFILLALFAGLGGSVGGVLLREYMDDSLKDSDDTEQYLNLPVIGQIPAIKTPKDVHSAKIKNVKYSIVLCFYLLTIGLVIKYRKPIKLFIANRQALTIARNIIQK